MRKIFADANAFGLVDGDKITITLLNKIGQELTTTYKDKLISLKKEIQISSNKIEAELYENDLINENSFYEINIKNVKFRFKINSSKDNLPHELTSLLQLGTNDGIAYFHSGKLVFEDDFIKKIELKLTNQEPYFTENQERVFNFFVYYADFVFCKNFTIDLEEKLDQYLGSVDK